MLGTHIVLSEDKKSTSFKLKIRVGDKVKSGKNYWIVTQVNKRFYSHDYAVRYNNSSVGQEYNSSITIQKIADADGKAVKSIRKLELDEAGVQMVITEQTIAKEVAKANEFIDGLYKILAM